MTIGMIVHSKTGNTLSVAERIKAKLLASGRLVRLERVEPVSEEPGPGPVALKSAPDIAGYDALIFAAPVHGFSLSPVMQAYCKQIAPLGGRKVSCFVTQTFPWAWMGGNRAVKQMTALITAKGGRPAQSGVINWSNKQREAQIEALIQKLSAL